MSDLYDREQAEAAEREATGGIFSGFSIGQHNVAKLHAARAKIKIQARMIDLLEERLKLLQSHLQTIFDKATTQLTIELLGLLYLDDDDNSVHEDEARNYTPQEDYEK